jgi:hypothetical protein
MAGLTFRVSFPWRIFLIDLLSLKEKREKSRNICQVPLLDAATAFAEAFHPACRNLTEPGREKAGFIGRILR